MSVKLEKVRKVELIEKMNKLHEDNVELRTYCNKLTKDLAPCTADVKCLNWLLLMERHVE